LTTAAIIGAGISGLACAERLTALGYQVTLFDKGRGAGGRMSTRRVMTEAGEVAFDHGAQFLTARDPAFLKLTEKLAHEGILRPWTHVVRLEKDGSTQPLSRDILYVGVPGMNSVVRALADGHLTHWGTRVTRLDRAETSGWDLYAEATLLGRFDIVVIAVPAEQVGDLLAQVQPAFAEQASRVRSDPCWTAMLAFDQAIALPWAACEPIGHDVLGFVSHNSSKPGRGPISALVVQATPHWSQAHLEDDQSAVADALWAALSTAFDVQAVPIFKAAHRWRYARVGKAGTAHDSPEFKNDAESAPSHHVGALWDGNMQLGVCGDWLLGPRIECGFLSGHRLGDMIANG
jgi:renalase